MLLRKACVKDVPELFEMLKTVQALHENGRPDIFKKGTTKYTHEQIAQIIKEESTPVFVLANEFDKAVGYAFCIIQNEKETENLYPQKTLYLDDLCVKEELRGQGYGKKIYNFVLDKAKEYGCTRLTLNVWHLNESALRFYEKLGMKPLKTTMDEKIKHG